jgi:AMP-polyphosphate phosphotransferase
MLEVAEIGHRISKEEYDREAPEVREALLRLQRDMQDADFSVLIIISGVEAGGRGETVNLLLEWMDARGVITCAFAEPSDEERERPRFWRYWMALPPKGKIGIHFGSWYADPIISRTLGKIDTADLDQAMDRIVEQERVLVNEDMLILKFWIHLSKDGQKARLKSLEEDPATRWRITKQAWEWVKLYDPLRTVAERALRKTNTAEAPWTVVEGQDARYRNLTIARTIQQRIEERLRLSRERPKKPAEKPPLPEPEPMNLLNQLDLTLALPPDKYDRKLVKYQAKLNRLVRSLGQKRRSVILVFEGPDAAGKGGAIRRITWALDARWYQVITVSAPTEEERAHPYLWRFWRHLPRLGRVTIYDRSWYGRVLVERLEGFASPDAWQRAYGEINAFEEQLVDRGIILLKFYLEITPEEQLKRFKQRQKTTYKQYKITEEDWRNREKWSAYEAAAIDMLERTSTELAPWTLVEANDKKWARIKVLKTICDRLEEAL